MNKPQMTRRLASATASVLTTMLLMNGVASLAKPQARPSTELAALEFSPANPSITVAQRSDAGARQAAMH